MSVVTSEVTSGLSVDIPCSRQWCQLMVVLPMLVGGQGWVTCCHISNTQQKSSLEIPALDSRELAFGNHLEDKLGCSYIVIVL